MTDTNAAGSPASASVAPEPTGTLEGAPGANSEALAARTDLAELLASWCSKSGHNMGHLLCGELVHRQHYEEADLILASSWLADHDHQIAERVWDEGANAAVEPVNAGTRMTLRAVIPFPDNPYSEEARRG